MGLTSVAREDTPLRPAKRDFAGRKVRTAKRQGVHAAVRLRGLPTGNRRERDRATETIKGETPRRSSGTPPRKLGGGGNPPCCNLRQSRYRCLFQGSKIEGIDRFLLKQNPAYEAMEG